VSNEQTYRETCRETPSPHHKVQTVRLLLIIAVVCLFVCLFVDWFVCLFVCLLVGWLVGWLVGEW